MATQKVLDAAADGLNACVVHPSGILGPNDPAIGQTTRTLIQILNGEMPIGMQGSFNLSMCAIWPPARLPPLTVGAGRVLHPFQ